MNKTIVQVLGLIIFFGVLVLVNAQIRNQPNTQERRQQPFDREKLNLNNGLKNAIKKIECH